MPQSHQREQTKLHSVPRQWDQELFCTNKCRITTKKNKSKGSSYSLLRKHLALWLSIRKCKFISLCWIN